MDLATLNDGSLVAVMRMDGGDADGEKWAKSDNHRKDLERDFDHFLPYHISRSVDGTTWSKLEPLPAGCARPRLLAAVDSPFLLMSGGRFHASKPKTSDVILWASTDSESYSPGSFRFHSASHAGTNFTVCMDMWGRGKDLGGALSIVRAQCASERNNASWSSGQ